MPTNDAFKDLTPFLTQLLFTATIGPLLFGYHLAELNAPQDVVTCAKNSIGMHPRDDDTYGLPQCLPMDALQFGAVTSLFTLGGFVGALLAGPLTAKQGRLRTMLITAVFAVIGPVFEALAPVISVLTIGRFLSGVGAGASTVVVPIYISEISPPAQKGFFGSLTQVMINAGILIAQLLGLFLSRGQLWRIILAVAGAIALAQMGGLLLGGQESPKWLADNNKHSQARRVLQKLRGHEADVAAEVHGWGSQGQQDIDDEEETLLRGEINAGLAAQTTGPYESSSTRSLLNTRQRTKGKTIGAFAVLQHPDYWPAVFAVAMIMVAQQLLGINSIVMYGVSLLSDLLASNAATLNVVVAAVNILVTIICAPLVDRLGRKTCLLFSMSGMGISSLLLAFGIMNSVPILSAITVLCFVASFGLGLGPVPFILSSELVDSEAVGATQSWALAANWIATFLVAQFFPLINEKLGKGQVYFIFAAFAALFIAFTAWWVPETKGKADADEVWGRKKSSDRES